MAAILLDSCVWGGALPILLELGHDVIWSGSWEQDPGDAAITNRNLRTVPSSQRTRNESEFVIHEAGAGVSVARF